MQYIYAVEYHSATKKGELMPFSLTRMDLEIIILSEASQTERCDITYMASKKSDTNEFIYKMEIES